MMMRSVTLTCVFLVSLVVNTATFAQSCTDSDNGVWAYTKGVVTAGTTIAWDACVSSSSVSEASCNVDGTIKRQMLPCVGLCVDGACEVEARASSSPSPSWSASPTAFSTAGATPSSSPSPSPVPTGTPSCYFKLTLSIDTSGDGKVISHTLTSLPGDYSGYVQKIWPRDSSYARVETYAQINNKFELIEMTAIPDPRYSLGETIVNSVPKSTLIRNTEPTAQVTHYIPYYNAVRNVRVRFPNATPYDITLLDSEMIKGGKYYCAAKSCQAKGDSIVPRAQSCCAGLSVMADKNSPTKFTCGLCGDKICAPYESFLSCRADCS